MLSTDASTARIRSSSPSAKRSISSSSRPSLPATAATATQAAYRLVTERVRQITVPWYTGAAILIENPANPVFVSAVSIAGIRSTACWSSRAGTTISSW